jgi:TPR repeat protein
MPHELRNDEELRSSDPDLAMLDEALAVLRADFSRARLIFEELASRGSIMAMLNLAFAFFERGDTQDAKHWYRAAYEKRSSTALFSLAMLENSQGFVRKAEILWEEGASKDDGPSVFRLAGLYLDSPDPLKHSQARALLEKADGLGQLRATVLLGQRLASGKYGIQNVPKGIVIFLRGFFSTFSVARSNPKDRRLW